MGAMCTQEDRESQDPSVCRLSVCQSVCFSVMYLFFVVVVMNISLTICRLPVSSSVVSRIGNTQTSSALQLARGG